MTWFKLDKPNRWTAKAPKKAVVFAHGFNSSSWGNFPTMLDAIEKRDAKGELQFYLANYDTTQGLRWLGQQLADHVEPLQQTYEDIALVGYSMGGLVVRLAVLERHLANVRRVVTIAAPNQGVFTPAQLSLMAQMMINNGLTAGAVRRHARGVSDLKSATDVMKEAIDSQTDADLKRRLTGKTYVTIPAAYFHQGRNVFQIAKSPTMKGFGVAMAAVNVMTDVLARKVGIGGGRPFINFEQPHDGLVALKSARMFPPYAGGISETVVVQPNMMLPIKSNLAHLEARICYDVDHVSLLQSADIAALVHAAIVAPTPGASASLLPAKMLAVVS